MELVRYIRVTRQGRGLVVLVVVGSVVVGVIVGTLAYDAIAGPGVGLVNAFLGLLGITWWLAGTTILAAVHLLRWRGYKLGLRDGVRLPDLPHVRIVRACRHDTLPRRVLDHAVTAPLYDGYMEGLHDALVGTGYTLTVR